MELTVFTPVYNRKELLKRLYDSLLMQTKFDFIWLIVDDGSNDDVGSEITIWKEQAPFEIQLIQQNNQGKHVAHNTAVKACKTRLFVCVDSDDELLPNAIEKIIEVDQHENREDVLGFYFRKVDTNGTISGGKFQLEKPYVGIRELYHKYCFKGELVIVLKTQYARMSSFPVFQGEKFVSELVYYNNLNKIAPMHWYDDVIYKFEYQETGYSKNSNRLIANNPYGAAIGYLSEAEYATKFSERVKNYAEYESICKVFKLNKDLVENKMILKYHFAEKIFAQLMLYHYNSLFEQIKKGRR